MKIPLNRQAKQPISLQISNRIGHLIHTGHLAPNAQLPSIRVLAQTAKVNKLTVLEAYSRLEANGLVRAKQGSGFFVNTPPPIKAFDITDQVIYVGTFSKTLMPGLRVGYMAVTGTDSKSLIERKLLHDFHVSAASQVIVKEYLASGHYRRRLSHVRALHRTRRDYMVGAIAKYLPQNVTWTIPEGGTFLWIQLPNGTSLSSICRLAAEQKVLVGSGSAFFPTGTGYPALRLNFSMPPEMTERGIAILGKILTAAQR